VIVGAFGAVVSNSTFTVPVPLFPDGSVTITSGLLHHSVPVQITAHPVLGFGVQVNGDILKSTPLSTHGHVILTAPLVGFGVDVHVGTVGAVVSTVKLTFVPVLVFPAASVAVIVALWVHCVNAGLIVIAYTPFAFA
jgi:hypothetical protein